MYLIEKLPYSDPIAMARGLKKHKSFVFLHSSMENRATGRYSILAFNPKRQIIGEDFTNIEAELNNNPHGSDVYFGYFGYETGIENIVKRGGYGTEGQHSQHQQHNRATDYKNSTNPAASRTPSFYIDAPTSHFIKFRNLLIFDNYKQEMQFWGESRQDLLNLPEPDIKTYHKYIKPNENGKILENFFTNISNDNYLEKILAIKKHIKRGDIYQANLTRKLCGSFTNPPDGFEVFAKLTEISPSPYSAYYKMGAGILGGESANNSYNNNTAGIEIISSSPEEFLKIDDEGLITTSPIKGSAARHENPERDKDSKHNLLNSDKEKAENLMITDLMRNDLARTAALGTVTVPNLFELTSYKNIHHLSSTVQAKLATGRTAIDCIKNAFPPGSMTGTPKSKAIEILRNLEKHKRGIYSGGLGYIAGNNTADFSVVIRTIIIQNCCFEMQTGGGITEDSEPVAELQESILKATPLLKALKISEKILSANKKSSQKQ